MKSDELLSGLVHQVLGEKKGCIIRALTENSQKAEDGSLFICRRGHHTSGQRHLEEAFRRGACAAIGEAFESRDIAAAQKYNSQLIQVENINAAEKSLASRFYKVSCSDFFMIGVTGTKGKTTICFMLFEILKKAGYTCAFLGTNGFFLNEIHLQFENTTPDMLTIYQCMQLALEKKAEIFIMEVSSAAAAEGRIEGISFDTGIFSNLSYDHIGEDEHSSYEDYRAAKMKFLSACRHCIVNADDREYQYIKNNYAASILPYSAEHPQQVCAKNISRYKKEGIPGSSFELCIQEGGREAHCNISLMLPGKYNVSNALAAAAAAICCGCSLKDISEGLFGTYVQGRTETAAVYNGAVFMIDYAHNGESLEKVLSELNKYKSGRLICMFGCGGRRSRLRRYLMGSAVSRYADIAVITQDNSRDEAFSDILKDIEQGMIFKDYTVIADRKEAIHYCIRIARAGDIVVFAGKGHENTMIINNDRVLFDEKRIIIDYINRLSNVQNTGKEKL